MTRRTGVRIAILVTAVILMAACGGANEQRVHTGASRDASRSLSDPPIAIDSPSTLIRGVGDRYLFVRSGGQVAAFDFKDEKWTGLPSPPDVVNAAIQGLGSTVILVGLDCDAECDESSPSPVVAAGIDLASPDPTWKAAALPFDPMPPEVFSPLAVGGRDDSAYFYVGHDLLSLSAALEVQQSTRQLRDVYALCLVGDAIQALVPTPEAESLPDYQRIIDPRATSTLAELPLTDLGGDWKTISGAETQGLESPYPFFSGILCGPRGTILVLGDRAYEWDGQTWQGSAIKVSMYGVSSSTRTSNGTVAGISGTDLVTLAPGGAWGSRPVAEQPSGSPPPVLQVAAIGESVVLLTAPNEVGATGKLSRVEL